MKHLLGSRFTIAVLDDVLMSVDAGHRREVCKLLQEKFPSTQFVLTTHDEVWLRHMASEGLVKNKAFAHFRAWHVDEGPTEWSDRDVWEDIRVHLTRNDVPQAAALLRRYLEHLSHELCHRMRSHVEFRADAQFMLGDLLPSAIGSMRKLLKNGKALTQSWKQEDKFSAIQQFESRFVSCVEKTRVDQWQVNAAVHYNQWALLQRADFEPVVEAFRALLDMFRCNVCQSLLYVVPERGPQEMLRCNCNNISINLASKT
jgi:hypothetical protein